MATAQKKSPNAAKMASASQTATKAASQTMNKTSAAAFSAVENGRSQAEAIMKMGTDTVKELFTNGTGEASKAHDKAFAIGRESAESVSRGVEAMSRTMNDMVSLFRENADAAIEVCHITSDICKSIHSEFVSCSNSNFVDNVELCKEAFACRNFNDMIEIQNKCFSTTMENLFSQSARFAEMYFQLVSEAAEPINERVAETAERFSKSMAA